MFENKVSLDTHGVDFVTRVKPGEASPLNSTKNHANSVSGEIELNMDAKYLPASVEIRPISNFSISPLKFNISSEKELGNPVCFNSYFVDEAPLNFYVDVFVSCVDKPHTFEVYGPDNRIFEWAQRLLSTRTNKAGEIGGYSREHTYKKDNIIDEICASYDGENDNRAMNKFVHGIGKWIDTWEYIYLIDLCQTYHESYDEYQDRDKLLTFLRRTLLPSHTDFEINSWNSLIQTVDTIKQTNSLPNVEVSSVINELFDYLLSKQNIRTNTPEIIWKIEEKCDLTSNSLQVLDEEVRDILLAMAINHSKYERARRIADRLCSKPKEGDLDILVSEAQNAEGEEALIKSKHLLKPTLDSNKTQFLNVASIYLDNIKFKQDRTIISKFIIERCLKNIYKELEKPDFERTARHYEHFFQGVRYTNIDEYQKASTQFTYAIVESLAEYSKYDRIHFTRIKKPIIRYYKSLLDELRKNNQYSKAVEKIEQEAIPSVSKLDYFRDNPSEKESLLNRLEAFKLEAEGDRMLSNQNLEKAVSNYGQAVGKLNKIGSDKQAEYLSKRRRTINAAIAEQNGDFTDAAKKHEIIVENSDNETRFSKFHRARAKICRAKKSIIQWEFQTAHRQISDVDISWGNVDKETKYIDLLLSELDKYQNGRTSDISLILDELGRLDLEPSNDLHVDFGHDYWPVFINILAAQKLKQIDSIDESISDTFIELSLNEVLKPNQVSEIASQRGLSDIQLDQQWMSRVPIFTLKQYQEVEKAEASKISADNYTDQVESLTGNLEQYLDFLVEYYGKLEYGQDWQPEISEGLEGPSLGNLTDYLQNSLFDDLPWIKEVRGYIQKKKYSSIVLPSKDGDIVDLRNDLKHNNVNHLEEDNFELIKSDIKNIFQETSVEIPILGKVLGQNKYGAYTVHFYVGGVKNENEIMTDSELNADEIYYFPPETLSSGPVDEIDAKKIVPSNATRVKEGIEKYGKI